MKETIIVRKNINNTDKKLKRETQNKGKTGSENKVTQRRKEKKNIRATAYQQIVKEKLQEEHATDPLGLRYETLVTKEELDQRIRKISELNKSTIENEKKKSRIA